MTKKVLLGMSGGVDSAVAAHLLLEQGYDVIAGFMKNYADESNPDCHTRQDRNMALKVSQHLGIKTFIIFDFREEYHETIIKYIYDTYKQGLTPNPDILCNTEVKFKLFLDKALELGCDYVATGHYARVIKPADVPPDKGVDSSEQREDLSGGFTTDKRKLLKGIDTNKDQSYFLSGLNQHQLRHSLFPLGELTKPQVREIAKKIELPNADRKDSQGLCFIGKVSMKDFLQEALPVEKGDIIDETGKKLGEHDGVRFHTIGQRQGLGLSGGPRYVIHRDITTNTLTVGPEDATLLFTDHLYVNNLHRVSGSPPSLPLTANVKIRYRQTDQPCTISESEKPADSPLDKGGMGGIGSQYKITFTTPQRAVSPGQTAVIYDGDELIASGIICG